MFRWKSDTQQCLRNWAVQLFHAGPMPNCRNSISPNPASQPARCRLILFQNTEKLWCAKFGDRRWKNNEKLHPQIWTSKQHAGILAWKNEIPALDHNFLLAKCFLNIHGAFRNNLNSFAADHSKTRVRQLRLSTCLGQFAGLTKQKSRESRFFKRLRSISRIYGLAPYYVKLTRAVAGAPIEAFTRAVPKCQGTHACPRASWAGVWLWRAPEGARLAHAGRYDINHCRGQQFVCQFARKFELLAGDHVSKNECVQTKISILFAVELGFSFSLPSAITHEAYKSSCQRAERAIADSTTQSAFSFVRNGSSQFCPRKLQRDHNFFSDKRSQEVKSR